MLPPSLRRQVILRRLQMPRLGFELLESRNLLSADLVLQPEIDQPPLVVEDAPPLSNNSAFNLTRLIDENDDLIELLASSRPANRPLNQILVDSRAIVRALDADEVDRVLEFWQ